MDMGIGELIIVFLVAFCALSTKDLLRLLKFVKSTKSYINNTWGKLLLSIEHQAHNEEVMNFEKRGKKNNENQNKDHRETTNGK